MNFTFQFGGKVFGIEYTTMAPPKNNSFIYFEKNKNTFVASCLYI